MKDNVKKNNNIPSLAHSDLSHITSITKADRQDLQMA